jgi:hypothetical protein
MARRSFDVFDLIELFTHWHAGRSQRQLAESLGVRLSPNAERLWQHPSSSRRSK